MEEGKSECSDCSFVEIIESLDILSSGSSLFSHLVEGSSNGLHVLELFRSVVLLVEVDNIISIRRVIRVSEQIHECIVELLSEDLALLVVQDLLLWNSRTLRFEPNTE